MNIVISSLVYALAVLCVVLTIIINPIMSHIYKNLGIQLPGLTEKFYDNVVIVECIMGAISIAALVLLFFASIKHRCASIILINIVVFMFSLFITVSAMPFIPVIESLGQAGESRPWKSSAMLPLLSLVIMSPFHVMSFIGLKSCLTSP
jgi:hypothetical protein